MHLVRARKKQAKSPSVTSKENRGTTPEDSDKDYVVGESSTASSVELDTSQTKDEEEYEDTDTEVQESQESDNPEELFLKAGSEKEGTPRTKLETILPKRSEAHQSLSVVSSKGVSQTPKPERTQVSASEL